MKCFAILVFSLLAESSSAGNCESHYKVDIGVISRPYREATMAFPVPHIVYGDNMTEFGNAFVNHVLTMGDKLTDLIYVRAKEIGRQLNKAVRKLSCDLQRCIKSIKSGDKKSSCADRILKRIIKQFAKFLSLMPGNVLIKRQALPELPEQTVNIPCITRKYTPAEIFLDLSRGVLNIGFASFYAYITTLHKVGWAAARLLGFDLLQTQIRNEILNEDVLKFYDKVTVKIIARGTECYVDPETWKSFKEDSADRVRFILDDYRASKDRECSS